MIKTSSTDHSMQKLHKLYRVHLLSGGYCQALVIHTDLKSRKIQLHCPIEEIYEFQLIFLCCFNRKHQQARSQGFNGDVKQSN
jgi:hypothetical protein